MCDFVPKESRWDEGMRGLSLCVFALPNVPLVSMRGVPANTAGFGHRGPFEWRDRGWKGSGGTRAGIRLDDDRRAPFRIFEFGNF